MSTENTADPTDSQRPADAAGTDLPEQGTDASASTADAAAPTADATEQVADAVAAHAPAPAGSTQPTEPLPPAPGASSAAGASPVWAPPAAGTHHPQSPYAQAPFTSPGTAPQYAFAPTTTAAPRAKVGAGAVAGIIIAAALVGGAAGLGGAYAGAALFAPDTVTTASGPASVTVNDTSSVTQTTGIATKVLPSVVTIEATSSSGGGTGSGVVLTSDGYVVTNTHVVTLDGATGDATVRVTTSDGRVYDADVVGTDPTYDLAVIKLVGAEDLTPIEFADSSDLNVGDQAVAIGAPLGLSNTVTTGIVSALNRSIQISSSAAPDTEQSDPNSEGNGTQGPFYFDFGQGNQGSTGSSETISIAVIQTDAAINPGNSGGALVDSDGKLIGINVAIASAGGSSGQSGSIGVGFSIPSNVVERVTQEIIDTGSATHGLLGASVQNAAAIADSTITGAYIAEVTDGGAAQRGGLQAGDIVTGFNGVPISDATDLTAQVRAAAAGSDATVTFVRDGQTRTVDVTLGQLGS
ncbi:trypsin-like peptidase domain-containing protein [Microbacterium sp. NPDC076895]|uniref:S1C family serine protease n=1 Tax=Microbacterium sp. NPDC076895 TaxID=3154957 RepID=UPI003443DA61